MPRGTVQAAATSDAVAEAQTHVDKWAGRLQAHQSELDALEAKPVDALLDDDQAAAELPRRKLELRLQIDTDEQMLAAAQDRLDAAKRDVLRVEVADLDRQIAAQEQELAAFDAKAVELMAALEAHTRYTYRAVWFDDPVIRSRIDMGERPELPTPARVPLEQQLDQLTRRRDVLRTVIDGGDPATVLNQPYTSYDPVSGSPLGVEDYPASVYGPQAVLPAPAMLRDQERAVAAPADAAAALQVAEAALEAFRLDPQSTNVAGHGWSHEGTERRLAEAVDAARRNLQQVQRAAVEKTARLVARVA